MQEINVLLFNNNISTIWNKILVLKLNKIFNNKLKIVNNSWIKKIQKFDNFIFIKTLIYF